MGGACVDRPGVGKQETDMMCLDLEQLTLAMYLEKGRPPSRANAHNMREAVATMPTVANTEVTMTTAA